MRRKFVREIEKAAYWLACEADLATNMLPDNDVNAQEIADLAGECIQDLMDIVHRAAQEGTIDLPGAFLATPPGL